MYISDVADGGRGGKPRCHPASLVSAQEGCENRILSTGVGTNWDNGVTTNEVSIVQIAAVDRNGDRVLRI